MTESDFEYLFRTLSEARSRATELTVAVRARAGTDHRLAALGHTAVSKIENLLRDVRVLAMEQGQHAKPAPARAPIQANAALPSEHWLPSLIDDLVALSRTPMEASFESVERLLQLHKQEFLQDLETARRMYRLYPHLFPAEISRPAGAS